MVTSSGEILGVLGHRPRIIYLYVGRWIRHRSSDSSLFLGEEGAFRSRSEIPRYGDRGKKEKERRDGRTHRPCDRDDRPTTIRLLTAETKAEGRGSDEK